MASAEGYLSINKDKESYESINETVETESTHVEVDDPHSVGSKNIGTNAAMMNLVKGNIGTGILAMPGTVKYSGLVLGPCLIIIVGFISTYLTHILLRCANDLVEKFGVDRNRLDYTETVFGVFQYGPERLRRYRGKMKHLTNAFMLITQIGFCCAYLLFISQNLQFFVGEYINDTVLNPASENKWLIIIASIVMAVLLSVCWIKNLKVIARIALFANLAAVVGIVLIMIYSLMDLQDWRKFHNVGTFKDFLIGFGIVIFAFEAINLVLPIQNKMKYPHRYVTWAGVVNTTMVFVVCLYAAMGFYGFLRFGIETQGSISYNLPKEPLWLSPIKPFFVFSILVSYLLQLYIPVIIFGKLLDKFKCHREASPFRKRIHKNVIPPVIVIFSYAFAISIPHFDLMLALLGSVSSSYLALILPPILNVISKYSDLDRKRNWFFKLGICSDVFIFLFGMLGFIGGTASSIIALVQTMSAK